MEISWPRPWLLAYFLFFSATCALADGVALPIDGGVRVLDGRTLHEVRTVELNSKEIPLLASHPTSPILAALSGDRLIFWNLPSFAEASRHQDSLFGGARSMSFSPDGSALFLLSADLRAVLKFDLATSRVVGTLPVPGGEPVWMEVTGEGVLVGQDDSVSLLSTDPQKGLLAQYRFPDRLSSAVVHRGRLFLARNGIAGLDSYEASSGRAVAFIPTSSVPKHLTVNSTGLFALSVGGEVQALAPDASRALWTYPGTSASWERLVGGGDGSSIYVYDKDGGQLLSLDSTSGQENTRISLTGAAGVPVIFSGNP